MVYHDYVIYADVLFLLNFFLDFFLLWATGRFLRQRVSYKRILMAALLGAFYGVGLVLPQLAFLYALWIKISFAFLMVRVAYPFQGWRKFVRLCAVFYLIGFAMAGAALGASTILAGAGVQWGFPQKVGWISLLFAIFVAGIVGKKGLRKLQQSWRKDQFQVKLVVRVDGRSCTLPALLDTGNHLRDPVSGKPVIVGEYALLAGLLPQGVRRAMEQYGADEPSKILSQPLTGGWDRRLRLVPFDSIGKKHGLLLGFRPDEILIEGPDPCRTQDVIVCFYNSKFAPGDTYRAIINPDVFLWDEEKKEAGA